MVCVSPVLKLQSPNKANIQAASTIARAGWSCFPKQCGHTRGSNTLGVFRASPASPHTHCLGSLAGLMKRLLRCNEPASLGVSPSHLPTGRMALAGRSNRRCTPGLDRNERSSIYYYYSMLDKQVKEGETGGFVLSCS